MAKSERVYGALEILLMEHSSIHAVLATVLVFVVSVVYILTKRNRRNNSTAHPPSMNLRNYSSVLFHGSPLSSPLISPVKKSALEEKDQDIVLKDVLDGKLATHKLESVLLPQSAVNVRRKVLQHLAKLSDEVLAEIPSDNYNYEEVVKRCCENVIGYVPIPLGFVGPLLVDGKSYYIPMGTTEGALLASTHRGCKAVSRSKDGITTVIIRDAMTRGPVVSFPSIEMVCDFCLWLDKEENFKLMEASFNSTTRFGKLKSIKTAPSGCDVYLRISASTGDAMGMNIVSKGSEKLLNDLSVIFPDMVIVSISGNYCTDKKSAAINWIEGRGKYVISSCVLTRETIHSVLKTSIASLIAVSTRKNMKGSIMAGSIGGFNAHAANMVSAIFIATGQDVAQAIVSSNCMTELESLKDNSALRITCTMPSIEVGTIGGGTHLPAQHGCLGILGIAGPNANHPGNHARDLARIVCATVLAGEISLLSSLAEGTLVSSHMSFNRGTK